MLETLWSVLSQIYNVRAGPGMPTNHRFRLSLISHHVKMPEGSVATMIGRTTDSAFSDTVPWFHNSLPLEARIPPMAKLSNQTKLSHIP